MKRWTLFSFVFLAVCSPCFAATYYVANTGNDSNPGSQTLPFLTIQKAADVATAGDTVIVKAGTYTGAKFYKSGTSAAPIVFRAEAGAIVAQQQDQNEQLQRNRRLLNQSL